MVAFDWDYVPVVIDCGGNTGFFGLPGERIIADTATYQVKVDGLGRKTRLPKGYATLPLPLDFPVKDMDSWLRVKKHLEFTEERIDWNKVERAKIERDERNGNDLWMIHLKEKIIDRFKDRNFEFDKKLKVYV